MRSENPDLCSIIDSFFETAFDLVVSNGNEYEKYRPFNTYGGILRFRNGENYQINYPSDDTSYEEVPILGITKYKELGYSLDFAKNLHILEKLSCLLKIDSGRYENLARLYVKCFVQIRDLATKPYEECNSEFFHKLELLKKQKNITE